MNKHIKIVEEILVLVDEVEKNKDLYSGEPWCEGYMEAMEDIRKEIKNTYYEYVPKRRR